MRRDLLLAAACGGFALATGPAFAAGCSITGSAPIVTATAISFGNYSAASATAAAANGTVQVRCPLGVGLLPSLTVALNGGTTSSFAPRKMSLGAARLNYNIYTTPGFGTVWGDGSGSTVTQTIDALILLGTVSLTAYGQVPAGQFVGAGTYNDTITVTITY